MTDPKTKTSADAAEKKTCPQHGTPLMGGMKYEDICLECQPAFKQWCSGCQRRLWDCMCIRPHTWE